MRRLALGAAGLLAAAALTGCASIGTQLDGLAPVGGGDITTLRIAVVDVLTEQGILMMDVPVCVEEAEQYTCSGTTIDGRPIVGTAPLTTPLTVTVTVGGEQLFQGGAMDVIDEAAGMSDG
jgi:hypothetical protein